MFRQRLFFKLLITGLIINTVSIAQSLEIKGDTVFVTDEFPVQIKFPSDNILASFTDPAAPYSWTSVGQNLQIRAKGENGKPSLLVVDEGKRHHSFFIAYKKDINPDNLSQVLFDLSTPKKLQQRIKEIADREAERKSAASAISATPNLIYASTVSTSNTPGYYALLEDGDKALQNEQLDEAQSKYEQVLRIQPKNQYAIKGLANVAEKKLELLRSKVALIKSNANKAFSERKYDEALKGYTEAISLDPNDLFSKSQVKRIQEMKTEETARAQKEKDRQAQLEIDSKIEDLRKKATKAYEEKKYDDAIAAYTQALQLNPVDFLIKNKIDAIQKVKNQVEGQRQKEAENRSKNEKFKTLVADADKAFENREYEVAKEGYNAALLLKSNEGSVEKKLALTNEKIIDKQKEEEYNTALSAGDEAKKAENYEKAKEQYKKASDIFKDRTPPKEKIAEIDKIVGNIAAKQREEKEKREKELEAINKYNSAIEKADKALADRDYTTAKTVYAQALSLKPEEEYPKSKLSEIEMTLVNLEKARKVKADSIASVLEINKKYDVALAKGKAALDKKDYKTAQIAYNEALELKPGEDEPRNKLELIDRQQNSVVLNAKYDSAMASGNLALADKNYISAVQKYKEALSLKPLESLPLNQLKYVQKLITEDSLQQVENQRRAVSRVQEEIRIKRFNEGMSQYANYERSAQIADYEAELVYLKKFLNIIPDNSELNNYQYNQKIEESKRKIQTIRDYLTRTKGTRYQAEAIPYLDIELEKKYENISFTAVPDDQTFDKSDSVNLAETEKVSRELLKEKGQLTLEDSSNNIKVICQAISFKRDKVFFKFLVQNSDATEFLTGSMQVSRFRKDNLVAKSNPCYISAFPIILPGKEFAIVYATKDIGVEDNETLTFNLNDRLKSKKLHISIPGKIYNEEKKQKM